MAPFLQGDLSNGSNNYIDNINGDRTGSSDQLNGITDGIDGSIPYTNEHFSSIRDQVDNTNGSLNKSNGHTDG